MSEKICPNCFFKNGKDNNFCEECGSSLNLDEYIESKKFNKSFFNKLKSFVLGKQKTKNINHEIEEFIILSQSFCDYENDLINLKSDKFDKSKFRDKYKIISKLDDFKYLHLINKDEDLNKKLLFLKSVKSFMDNFDDEIKKSKILLKDIKSKIPDIDSFNRDFDELLNSDVILDVSNKNDLILSHKATFDFFDRQKVRELNIESKEKIIDFLNTYENIDSIIKKRNDEFKTTRHNELLLKHTDKAKEFLDTIYKLKESEDFITTSEVGNIGNEFQETYDFFSSEEIPIQSKATILKFLSDFENLNEIVNQINEELSIKILERKVDDSVDTLNQFNADLNYLLDSNFYITFKQKDELKEFYQDLFDLISEADEKIELSDEFKEFLKTYPEIDSIIDLRNEDYVENELVEHEEFFDNIDGKSLDDKQRLAVVKNDLNTQIIAGAGCGKTLTVNAKVRYLIEKKGISPPDILCLSFSNLSVRDLEDKLPEGIEISTFHKLGGQILRANNKPSRPDSNALDNFIKIYFRDIVINNEKLSQDLFEFFSYYFYTSIDEDDADSIGEVYDIDESRDFKTLRNLYGGENEKITWKNEEVKSFEELIIANYLFAHQIDYDYERVYECENRNYFAHKHFVFNLVFDELSKYPEIMDDLLSNLVDIFEIKEHVVETDYLPDFYLCDENIYLEHFGVNRNCQALWLNDEESQKYSDGIKWKRNLHKSNGSSLIETYSYYMSEDRLLLRLEEKLKGLGVEIKPIDYLYLISKIVERDDVNKFKDLLKLIKNFIELFKGNGFTIDKFSEFREINKSNPKIFERRRNELFLNLVEDIYISYENYLRQIKKIDFNDMINNATLEVRKGNLKNNYKYIIVDEYQDTSHTRYNLVKAIQDKTGAKVCVVGDDWQSIYRFTGCDVSLFTKFENYFENPVKLRIETTYRNSQDLIDISGKFINKNPNQITKKLKSKKDPTDKPVKIIYYNKKSQEDKIKKMEFLIDKIAQQSDRIMIIGRNNFDICPFADGFKKCNRDGESKVKKPFKKGRNNELIYDKNPDLHIGYITVHKSKGLEEDNVILINLENKRAGFPNQIEDDSVLDFVINDSDQFEFGEERRLFYVALTRTRNNVYLLAPDNDKSVFVNELEENIGDLEILKTDDDLGENLDNPEDFMKDKKVHSIKTPLKCPTCKTGDINLIIVNKGTKNLIKFFTCSHERCEWDGGFYNSDLELLDEIEICPECGAVMQVRNGKYGPFFSCSNRCRTPKITGEKLERVNMIIEEMERNINFETHEVNLDCPECGIGKVTLNINPDNKQKHFACSNDECSWKGGKTSIDLDDLDKIEICPDCGGILTPRNGKRGKFFGCSNFPKCRFTKDLDGDNDEDVELCPDCGSKLLRRNGRKGPFLGCSAFPNCKYTRDIDEDVSKTVEDGDVELCPDCGSKLVKRNGRNGPFLGCSAFPKCRYTRDIKDDVVLDEDVELCPKCGSKLVKRNGQRGSFLGCSNFPKCRFTKNIQIKK